MISWEKASSVTTNPFHKTSSSASKVSTIVLHCLLTSTCASDDIQKCAYVKICIFVSFSQNCTGNTTWNQRILVKIVLTYTNPILHPYCLLFFGSKIMVLQSCCFFEGPGNQVAIILLTKIADDSIHSPVAMQYWESQKGAVLGNRSQLYCRLYLAPMPLEWKQSFWTFSKQFFLLGSIQINHGCWLTSFLRHHCASAGATTCLHCKHFQPAVAKLHEFITLKESFLVSRKTFKVMYVFIYTFLRDY